MTGAALRGPVLVTGAGGMIGRALTARLREQGVVDLLTPSRAELDLADPIAVAGYWGHHRPNVVFHLAGYVRGILGNMQAGVVPLLENARIQSNLLEAALVAPPAAMVVAGTVAAYGHPFVRLPLREEDFWSGSPHGAEALYAAGKRLAIPYLEALPQVGCGARYAILTNIYGPHDRFDEAGAHVVPSLIGRFLAARRSGAPVVTVWGEPPTTRDFLYSEDAAQHLIDLAVAAEREGDYEAVNVASGVETTMGELARTIVLAVGFEGSIAWDADAPIGIPRRSVDITRLRQCSDLRARSLAEGVDATVRWCEGHLR